MSSTVLPLYLHCACRDRHCAGDIHASRSPANLALRECLIRSRALEASHRHPFLLPRVRVEPSSSRAVAGDRPGHFSPLRSISSHPKPLHLALHLLRPFQSSFEPTLGRISACATVGRHCRRRSFAPPVELPLPALLSSNRARGENPRELLLLTDLFPRGNRRHRRRLTAAPPQVLCAAVRAAAEPPCARSRSAAASPRAACPAQARPAAPPVRHHRRGTR